MIDKDLIFFDGVCTLCNSIVQTILKHDKKNHFLFASLQSLSARELLFDKLKEKPDLDSIILLQRNGQIKFKSSAVLSIAKYLSFPLNTAYVFIVIPRFIRDWVYDVIASNRYRWFGKKDECWLPTPELKSRFLP